MMPLDGALRALGHIPEQVESVGDLNRLWRSAHRGVGVGTRAIAADELNARSRGEPRSHRVRLSIREEIDHSMSLEVDENRSVARAFFPRPVIDADDARRGWLIGVAPACRRTGERGPDGTGATAET
jgi:hypothetical protein